MRWLDDDATGVEEEPADSAANLVSLGFFTAALRRSRWFWRTSVVVGLLVGCGLYLRTPHTYQASTTLLLTVGAESQQGQAILEDQALAESRAVAVLTLHRLGSHESINRFLASYQVTPLTDRVLQITATAPSRREAVSRASALATEYLSFRADQLRAEQQLQFTAFGQQISQDKQHLASITEQLGKLPASSPQRTTLVALAAQGDSDLASLEQQVSSSEAASRLNTATMIGGSAVLDDASPVPQHSRLKYLLLYAAGGLIIGLVLGIGIVILRALLSDRLRRRDDVAQAVGAPVLLSVPTMRARGWLPGRRRRVSDRHVQRIASYLGEALLQDSRRAAALAIVPVDDPQVAAQFVVALAEACAQQGRRVVLADLCSGAPAAKLLGANCPGVHGVTVGGASLVAAVPDPAEWAPVGPRRPTSPQVQPADPGVLAAAFASADLLLTLITLDPSIGGDHLATWAPEAVVMVTAGRSSWTKIHSVGEMVRLSGTRLVGAVLLGTDKTDESIGLIPSPAAGRDAASAPGERASAEPPLAGGRRAMPSGPNGVITQGMPTDAEVAMAGGRTGGQSDDTGVHRPQLDPPEHLGPRQRTGR